MMQYCATGMTTELDVGRMYTSEKILLVLVSKIHFWVCCFLYYLEICCLQFLKGFLLSLSNKVKKTKTCVHAVAWLHYNMLLPILHLLSSVGMAAHLN